ncbi:MAG: hypothetical protein JSU86_00805 [Phycisphaerales bacterium]|nr:MAG: hypothetical protein JSU86_00805 [Phycisphaerales bacterium]
MDMGPFSYRLPDDFGGFGSPDVTVTLSVYREDLYFIVSDFYEYWLVRVSLDSHQAEVFEMFDATLEVVADSNHIYVLEGLQERSVVRYDYSYSPASREVLLDADFFGPDGRIEDITLERLAFSTFALHVLHTHGLARVPLDGGDPAIVYTFDADDPPERPRCCLNAVYTRPSECDRTYGDFDADGVIRLCDKCPDTPSGVEVDDTGRPLADVNQDCVVDRQDFAIVRESFTRSAGKGHRRP